MSAYRQMSTNFSGGAFILACCFLNGVACLPSFATYGRQDGGHKNIVLNQMVKSICLLSTFYSLKEKKEKDLGLFCRFPGTFEIDGSQVGTPVLEALA